MMKNLYLLLVIRPIKGTAQIWNSKYGVSNPAAPTTIIKPTKRKE
jgi:hypothetical protein